MRLARSNDTWRELYRRADFRTQWLRVQYSGVTALGQSSIEFTKPLSLVCGENGVGKTTLLRVLHRALSEWREDWNELRIGFPTSAMSGTIQSFAAKVRSASGPARDHETAESFLKDNEKGGDPIEVVFVDTATLIPHLFRLFRADQNLPDLIDGVAPRVLKGNDLATVCQLVGRDYEKVEIFEIAEYDEYERLPYFRVTTGGTSYGSESMGTGEMALLYLFWMLDVSTESSILLLEEPESFVAPRSQRLLVDWIAEQTLEKKLFVVLSSHSGQIAERFPADAISLCSRTGAQTTVQTSPQTHVLVERLNLLSHRRCLVLVEDVVAEAFAGALIRSLEPRLYIECDIVVAGSNGRITSALSNLPLIRSKRVVAIGLYDGDQADQKLPAIDWPRLFLPGEHGPEKLVRELCGQLDILFLAKALGVTDTNLRVALGGAEGAEDHDWLSRVCGTLELDIRSVFRALVPFWLREHEQQAVLFSKTLVEAARRPF